jgi:N-methylhydantoinase A
VWCAFGAASADVLHVDEQVAIMASPFELARVNGVLATLGERGRANLDEDGVAPERQRFRYSIDMRHRGQINEVEVDLDGGTLDEPGLVQLRERFVQRYERLYGHGAALLGARLEMVTFRCRAEAYAPKPRLVAAETLTARIAPEARTGTRAIWWAEWKRAADTPIYDGYRLLAGNALDGPCVVETATTSVVVHPGQRLEVDALGNFVIDPNAR